jgi:hypothetical protein
MPTDKGEPVDPCAVRDLNNAEVIVLVAYMQLPFLQHREEDRWMATLRRFTNCELRLVERVLSSPGPVLHVELFDFCKQSVVNSRVCDGVEEAAEAFFEMIPAAEAYSGTSPP